MSGATVAGSAAHRRASAVSVVRRWAVAVPTPLSEYALIRRTAPTIPGRPLELPSVSPDLVQVQSQAQSDIRLTELTNCTLGGGGRPAADRMHSSIHNRQHKLQ